MTLDEKRQDLLNRLIGMPKLLHHPSVWEALSALPQLYGNDLVRKALERLRSTILEAETAEELEQIDLDPDQLAEQVAAMLREKTRPSVDYAVNATGIILHTALGRAPLAKEAQENIRIASSGYATIAVDRETGRRGDRYLHVEDLLTHLTGAESAVVVNNNCAATIVLLNTLASGKEVIISRGQLVEIGGSFRIPEVMERSSAIMVEVGTTNKTHLKDYRQALNQNTGLILRVHASNYLMTGFTSQVSVKEMADLAHQHNLPMADDIGSGCLLDLTQFGLPAEPLVQDSIKDGADLVCFSGDKMLGGPQCGIIVGKKAYIDRIKKNPLVRAFRCCKLTYSALEATLKLFLEPETLPVKHPVINLLTRTPGQIGARERAFWRKMKPVLEGKCSAEVVKGFSQMGSGSLPGRDIPTMILTLKPVKITPDELAHKLRKNHPPIFARIEHNAVALDFRTLWAQDEKVLQEALVRIFR